MNLLFQSASPSPSPDKLVAEIQLKESLRAKIAAYKEKQTKSRPNIAQKSADADPLTTVPQGCPLSGLMDTKVQEDFIQIMWQRKSQIGYPTVKYEEGRRGAYYKWPKMVGFGERSLKDIKNGKIPIDAVFCVLIPRRLGFAYNVDNCVVLPNSERTERKPGDLPMTMMKLLTNLEKIQFFDPINYKYLNRVFEQLELNNSTRWCDADTKTYLGPETYTPDNYLLEVKRSEPLPGGWRLVSGDTEKRREEIGLDADCAYESDIVPAWFIMTHDRGIEIGKPLNLKSGVEFSGFGSEPPKFLLKAVNNLVYGKGLSGGTR